MYIILTGQQVDELCGCYGNYFFGANKLTNGTYAALASDIDHPNLVDISAQLAALPTAETVAFYNPRKNNA